MSDNPLKGLGRFNMSHNSLARSIPILHCFEATATVVFSFLLRNLSRSCLSRLTCIKQTYLDPLFFTRSLLFETEKNTYPVFAINFCTVIACLLLPLQTNYPNDKFR